MVESSFVKNAVPGDQSSEGNLESGSIDLINVTRYSSKPTGISIEILSSNPL